MDTPPGNQAQPPSERDQVPQPVLPEVNSPLLYSRTSTRNVQPAVESHVPWKSNPSVFSGDSSDYLSFRKEKPSYLLNTLASVTFSPVLEMFQWLTLRYPPNKCGIWTVRMTKLTCTEKPGACHYLTNRSLSDESFPNEGATIMTSPRKACQFLRSALKTKVDLNILYRVRSPAEAWINLESRRNPRTIAATQSLHHRFQDFTIKPG